MGSPVFTGSGGFAGSGWRDVELESERPGGDGEVRGGGEERGEGGL